MKGSTIVPSRLTKVPPNSTQNALGKPPALTRRNEAAVVTPLTRSTLATSRGACHSFRLG
ncbi:hypothetical protein GCM10009677_54340 [Sphaerisporangium rubeum]